MKIEADNLKNRHPGGDSPVSGRVLFVLVLLLATALRFYGIDNASLWADELWGVTACSQGSWWAMIQDMILNDSHPPGYQSLLYVWMQVLPQSDLMIRLPSALAGIAAVWLVFEMGRRWFSSTAGLVAALLVATAYQAIYYSQEARAYAFLMLLAPLSVWFFVQLFVARRSTASDRAGFVLSNLLLAYMHYVGTIFLAGELLLFCMLCLRRDRAMCVSGLKLFALVLLGYAPWLPVMYHHMVDAPDSWSMPKPDVAVLWQTVLFLFGPDGWRIALTALLLMVAVVSALRQRHEKPALFDEVMLLLSLAVLPLVIFYLKSVIWQSAYTLRHFVYMIPLFALLAGHGLGVLIERLVAERWRQRMLGFLLFMFAVASLWQNSQLRLYDNNFRNDFRGSVTLAARDADCVKGLKKCLFVEGQSFFRYYTRRVGLPGNELVVSNLGELPLLEKALNDQAPDVFYFMVVKDGEPSALQRNLESRFDKRCETRLNKMLLMQFDAKARQQEVMSELPDCPLRTVVDKYHIR